MTSIRATNFTTLISLIPRKTPPVVRLPVLLPVHPLVHLNPNLRLLVELGAVEAREKTTVKYNWRTTIRSVKSFQIKLNGLDAIRVLINVTEIVGRAGLRVRWLHGRG